MVGGFIPIGSRLPGRGMRNRELPFLRELSYPLVTSGRAQPGQREQRERESSPTVPGERIPPAFLAQRSIGASGLDQSSP